MLLGLILKKINVLNDEFVKVCNKFNFTVTLPVMLFNDISQTDIIHDFDVKYVFFTAGTVAAAFFIIWILAKIFIKDKASVGAFVQASYRSSAAVLGTAFIMNMYGTSGMAPLMIIGSVPLFNVFAVLVLTFEDPTADTDNKRNTDSIKKAALNVLKNPIIISIFLGMVSSLLGIKYPAVISKTLSSVASLASPLALIAVGAGFKFSKTIKKIKPVIASSVIKLIVLPACIIPLAAMNGFADEKLVALIIMAGSPTTPSSYIMAESMNGDGNLTLGSIMLTTLCSSVTLTLWIFICKSRGLIA